MGKKSKRKNRPDRRANPFAGLKGIKLPDGTPCPDCSAVTVDNKLKHDPTCPAGLGIDRVMDMDRAWFEEHPGQSEYPRKITQAEITEHQTSMPDEPPGTHVVVTQIAPGLRQRRGVRLVIFDPRDGSIFTPKTDE
jgi:hypothetical protein